MIRALIAVAVVLLFGLSVQSCRLQESRADQAASELKQAQDALQFTQRTLEHERARSAALAQVAQQYEQDKADAQIEADRLADDLRADNRRLRSHWQAAIATSQLSRESAAASFADGGAELRQRDIAAVRGIVGRCQAQVIGLQAIVKADRQ